MEEAIGQIVQEELGNSDTSSHRFLADFNVMKQSVHFVSCLVRSRWSTALATMTTISKSAAWK